MALRSLPSFDSLSATSRQPIKQPDGSFAGGPSLPASVKTTLMALPGVVGVGKQSDTVLVVYLNDARAASRLPAKIDGYVIKPEVVGTIRAY